MLSHNQKLRRVVLDYPRLASPSDVERLKIVVASEMSRRKATRGLIRVLTDKPVSAGRFDEEARIPTSKGLLHYLALNHLSRMPLEETVRKESEYAVGIICARGRQEPGASAPGQMAEDFRIVRLDSDRKAASALSELLLRTYSSYPVPLDPDSVSDYLKASIPYAVIGKRRMVSALVGVPARFGELHTIEFTLMASAGGESAIPMTTALAERIRAEAMERFDKPLMLAETIAGPVMRSCHDLGMELRGLLKEHYHIGIKGRTYTNLYLWSL